jgi:hypothetical protein
MRPPKARVAVLSLVTVCVSACTSGQVGTYPVTHTNPTATGKLQFSVGWATQYPTNPAQPSLAGYGLNFVETFRQSDGRSAVLSDSVEIDVPATLSAQLANYGQLPNLTFGTTVEAFGAGLNSGSFTTPGAYAPLVGTGGPPAFPAPGDSTSLTQEFSEGYYASFPIVPITNADSVGPSLASAQQIFPGRYTLNVTIPTGQTSTELASASATLGGTPLPPYQPPSVAADGNGGALVTIAVPAGVTETLVTIVGTACQTQTTSGSASPAPVTTRNETYTLVSHVAGPGTDRLSLPDFITPVGGLGTFESLCPAADYAPTGGGYQVYAVGFDYPAFESVYPQSSSQTPTIVGTAGQADLTISSPASFTTP